MTAPPALEFRGITKRYGAVTALESVDLTVERGELLTLLGPSGSGKTTLLKLLAGFEVPDAGQIVLNGREISALPPAKRNVGMVFQHYALFPHLNVLENVSYGLRYRGIAKKERLLKAERMLELVRLSGYGQRYPRQLSGGQQQRVAIARALAIEPDVLLMDEPLGALDRELRLEMEQEIRRLHHALETTFIYVTHDQEEALTLSDRVVIMRGGRLAAMGAPRALYENPTSAFVARFFGGANIFPLSMIEASADEAAVLVASPSAFSLSPTGSAEIAIEVLVEDAVFLGNVIQLVCAPTTETALGAIKVWLSIEGAGATRVGDEVRLFVPLHRLRQVPDE